MFNHLTPPPTTVNTNNGGPSTRQISLTCSGHTRPVVQLSFSKALPDGSYYLVSACKDGKPILCDGKTGDWLGTFIGHKGAVWSIMLDDRSDNAVTASADFTAKVWDAHTGQELVSLPHEHIVRSADFVDGKRDQVVTGGQERLIRLFDLNRPDSPATLNVCHKTTVKNVRWISAASLVMSSSEDGAIHLTDLRTGKPARTLSVPEKLTRVSVSIDGSLVSCGAGNKAYIWDAKECQLLKNVPLGYDASVVSVHPGRTRFVVGSVSETCARVHDYESGAEIAQMAQSMLQEDGTVRLWQTIPGTAYGLWQPRTI
ncbi:hypothetical protein EV182_002162 [Spiromyces aspiralis]|uniref:Uncharacterized protein n=1 Tax=Spiromyces aspiralis TaxID=68401 RepID=A0ACC1HUF1_9FUNG|nr:hypothetical protein EV182_002162 [Spiromyces aspiralis]